MDISNGEGIGVSLFVQGCPFHCKSCFNQETWNYDEGREWNQNTEQLFLKLVSQSHIIRVSFLGGEPLYQKNINGILNLCKSIKAQYPNKKIWIYTGYTFETIFNSKEQDMIQRQQIVKLCDVMIDGQFIDSLKDMNLKFKGSSNQRVINIEQTLKQNKIVTYKNY